MFISWADSKYYFRNAIYRNLVAPYKKILAFLISQLEKHGVAEKCVAFIANVLTMRLHGSTQIYYVKFAASELEHVSDNNSCAVALHCAKPQYFYQNYPLESVFKDLASPLILTEAKVIGSSNFVVTADRSVIYELHYNNKLGNYVYNDTAFFLITSRGFLLKARGVRSPIENGIFLCGNFSSNYYHFLFEIVSKFWYLKQMKIPVEVPLLVDSDIKNVPQLNELLSRFNRDERPVVYLEKGSQYSVNVLYFLPTVNFIPPDFLHLNRLRYDDCAFNLGSLRFLRDTLLPVSLSGSTARRIFLSRKFSRSRRRCNEEEVQRVFRKHGFEVFYPETMSIDSQIRLFNSAEFIAGVTGAAFTNLIFCRSGCKALCIQSCVIELSIFSTIAKYVGVDFQYFVSHDSNYMTNDLHEKFTVNVEKLERVLVEFLLN